MTPTPIDDDTLLAYLDAQWDDEARYVAVEDALAAQPALRARLQALVDSGEQARRAFDAVLEAPVPPALIAAILNAPLPTAASIAAPMAPTSFVFSTVSIVRPVMSASSRPRTARLA